MIRTVISCDVCKRDKDEVNHWWTVWIFNSEFNTASLSLIKQSSGERHVCGASCAGVLYQRFLSNGTLDMETSVDTRKDKTP